MEINKSREGQVFTFAAVLFASLIIVLFITTSDTLPQENPGTFQNWFENSFRNIPIVFNEALKEDNSIDKARNDIYSYNRFIERRSETKGVVFSSNYLLVFPEDGQAVFINYQTSSTELKLKTGSKWTNTTVQPKQNIEVNYTPGLTDFRLIVPSHDIDTVFKVSNPRIFSWMEMSGHNQIWVNSGLN